LVLEDIFREKISFLSLCPKALIMLPAAQQLKITSVRVSTDVRGLKLPAATSVKSLANLVLAF